MSDTFSGLLSSIGFGAADASNQFSQIDRQRQLADSNSNLANQVSKKQLVSQQEGNGVLSSGETGAKMADLSAAHANQLAGIDLTAADAASTIQQQVLKDKAAADATAAQLSQQNAQYQQSQQFAQQQMDQQTNLYNQQHDLAQQQANWNPYAYLGQSVPSGTSTPAPYKAPRGRS